MKRNTLFLLLSAALLLSCGGASVPSDYVQADSLPRIYPDYIGVTIPQNIAPLTFELD